MSLKDASDLGRRIGNMFLIVSESGNAGAGHGSQGGGMRGCTS
jgi:hypothetical protein